MVVLAKTAQEFQGILKGALALLGFEAQKPDFYDSKVKKRLCGNRDKVDRNWGREIHKVSCFLTVYSAQKCYRKSTESER